MRLSTKRYSSRSREVGYHTDDVTHARKINEFQIMKTEAEGSELMVSRVGGSMYSSTTARLPLNPATWPLHSCLSKKLALLYFQTASSWYFWVQSVTGGRPAPTPTLEEPLYHLRMLFGMNRFYVNMPKREYLAVPEAGKAKQIYILLRFASGVAQVCRFTRFTHRLTETSRSPSATVLRMPYSFLKQEGEADSYTLQQTEVRWPRGRPSCSRITRSVVTIMNWPQNGSLSYDQCLGAVTQRLPSSEQSRREFAVIVHSMLLPDKYVLDEFIRRWEDGGSMRLRHSRLAILEASHCCRECCRRFPVKMPKPDKRRRGHG